MKGYFFYISVLSLLASSGINAQNNRPLTDNPLISKLDLAVNKQANLYFKDGSAVGLSIGVIYQGKKYTYNYGEIEKGSGILPDEENFYGIGSIDKTFATTLLAEAVVYKKVELNDDIRKYLPTKYANLTYKGKPIELINLTNHTSGLPGNIKTYSSQVNDSLRLLSLEQQVIFLGQYSQDSLLADLHNVILDTIPGTKFNYNNNDIKLLIVLLERIYHDSYKNILASYLHKKLKMYDTKTELSPKEIERAATGYFRNNSQKFVNFRGFYIGIPVISTVNDMLKYLSANLNENDEAIKLTHERTWGDKNGFGMGLGWMIDYESNGEKYYYHSGNTRLGYNSYILFYPDKKWGIIIFANDTRDLQKLGELVSGIRLEIEN